MNVTCTVNTSSLSRGIAAANGYSKRTLPEIINTSGYWISINAKAGMPFVTPEKIDAELAVIPTQVIGKRGQPLKRKKTFSGGMSPIQRSSKAPLATLIVLARTNPRSNYNALTNNRYALPSLRGMSASGFHAAVAALEDKMVKTRHRSGKFLLSGWIPVVQKMAFYAVQKFSRGGPSPSEGRRNFYGADLGHARPAFPGELCSAEISNDVGTEGVNAASFNRALMLHGVPALQSAVDREGVKQMEYALKKAGEELKQEWDKV